MFVGACNRALPPVIIPDVAAACSDLQDGWNSGRVRSEATARTRTAVSGMLDGFRFTQQTRLP